MYFSFENERLPLQLVTMRIMLVRCAISTFGNEHLIRLYIVSYKESVINAVFRIIEELIRIVNKLKKVIAKTSSVSSWKRVTSFSAKRSISSGLRMSNLARKQYLECRWPMS